MEVKFAHGRPDREDFTTNSLKHFVCYSAKLMNGRVKVAAVFTDAIPPRWMGRSLTKSLPTSKIALSPEGATRYVEICFRIFELEQMQRLLNVQVR
jgi:hypothetical protein